MNTQNTITEFKLNDNILTWLTPIYFVHKVLGSSRVIIKNKFVTTTGSWEIFYSIVWILAVATSMIHYGKVYYLCYYDKSTVVYLACTLIVVLLYISYLCNIVYIRFFNKEACVKLLILLQKINSDLLLEKSKFLTTIIVSLNIILLVLVTVPFEIFFVVHVLDIVDEPVYTIFLALGVLIIYTDIVFTAFFIMCLTLHIGYLNNLIIQYNIQSMPDYRGSGIRRWRFLGKYLKILTRQNADKEQPEFYKYLNSVRDILKCYKTVTDLFSFSVLNIAATVLIWTFIVIAVLFFGLRTKLLSKVAVITGGMWPVFYFLQLTILALFSDMFIQETKNTKLLCIRILSYIYDGPIRKTASNVIREIQIANPKFNVFKIFILDKRIPLHLFGIITSNIIVITQFKE